MDAQVNDVVPCEKCGTLRLAPVGTRFCYVCEAGDSQILKSTKTPDIRFFCIRCGRIALAPKGSLYCEFCEAFMDRESMTAAKLRELVGRDNVNIIEIGANDGADTVRFLEAFPHSCIVCFECDPRAIELFDKATEIWGGRCRLVPAAVADAPGKRLFHPSGGKPPGKEWTHVESWNMSGSLLEDDQHTTKCPWLTFGEPFEVDVVTLDDVMASVYVTPTIIWIDVQGAEAMVLKGGQKTIAKAEWVYLECHAAPLYKGQATIAELIALLPGFKLHSKWAGDNYLFKRVAP